MTVRARVLRNAPSPPEVRLWAHLRRLKAKGYHFRRQAKQGDFYLDFACLSYRLAIEVDGVQHFDKPQMQHDAMRDRILRREGFTILRFPAFAVMRNPVGVVDEILLVLAGLSHRKEVRKAG